MNYINTKSMVSLAQGVPKKPHIITSCHSKRLADTQAHELVRPPRLRVIEKLPFLNNLPLRSFHTIQT